MELNFIYYMKKHEAVNGVILLDNSADYDFE